MHRRRRLSPLEAFKFAIERQELSIKKTGWSTDELNCVFARARERLVEQRKRAILRKLKSDTLSTEKPPTQRRS